MTPAKRRSAPWSTTTTSRTTTSPPFEHSGFWDETLMQFPPSRPAATERAMARGE